MVLRVKTHTKEPLVPIKLELSGLQSLCRHSGENKNLLPLLAIEFLGHAAHRLVT
jgi:hypothetical protein